jgi:hypothetical protein
MSGHTLRASGVLITPAASLADEQGGVNEPFSCAPLLQFSLFTSSSREMHFDRQEFRDGLRFVTSPAAVAWSPVCSGLESLWSA